MLDESDVQNIISGELSQLEYDISQIKNSLENMTNAISYLLENTIKRRPPRAVVLNRH